MDREFSYDIIKKIAVLSEKSNGWSRQLNLISWNGGEAKYDIRDWAPEHEKMGKGISLTAAELMSLSDAIGELEL